VFGELVSEEARDVIFGQEPRRHPSRVLIIGTEVETQVFELRKAFQSYSRERGVEDCVVHLQKFAGKIADAFFGLGDDFDGEPTLPAGVLIGTHVRGWDPRSGLPYTEEIGEQQWMYEGVPLEIIEGLCKKYNVPLIKINEVDSEKAPTLLLASGDSE
jgi:hypothetical protein